MVLVYILALDSGKYYVGKTNIPLFKTRDHFDKFGSTWTSVYKPVNIIALIPNCRRIDEDIITLLYMSEKGIDNVRGGTFSQNVLNDKQLCIITRNIGE
jgi:hypothetical protein